MAGHLQVKRRTNGHFVLLAVALFGLSQIAFKPGSMAVAVLEDGSTADGGSTQPNFGEKIAAHSKSAACGVALLVCLMASAERPVAPAAVVPLEKRSDYSGVLFINALLSLTAGMLNALAFLEMAATIAHHSGNLTHWGRNWGIESFRFGGYLAGFMLGGAVVGYVKADCEAIFVGRYSAAMLSTVIAVVGGTMLKMMGGEALPTLVLWSLALGIQNGLCRKFSSMPLCSTHFTGYLTDAGNFLGTWVRSKTFGEVSPNMMKCFLFIVCMVSFAAGGFVAKIGRDTYGLVVAFVPAVLMAAVAIGVFPLPPPPAAEKK